ncbi:hypothetical protein GCM10023192_37940 [Amycolatopsis samaneae]
MGGGPASFYRRGKTKPLIPAVRAEVVHNRAPLWATSGARSVNATLRDSESLNVAFTDRPGAVDEAGVAAEVREVARGGSDAPYETLSVLGVSFGT